MKTLILTGSPREKGHTAEMVQYERENVRHKLELLAEELNVD